MRGAAARRLLGEPGEQDLGPLSIRFALEPDLWLRDVGGTSPTMLDACWLKTWARMPAWFSRSATRKASKRARAT